MSEPVAKQRPTANLDTLERRLRQTTHPQAHEEDPLAELARLVGEQHDPYGDVFAQEARPRQPLFEQEPPARERQEPPARQRIVPLGQGRLEPAFDLQQAAQSGQAVPSISPRLFGDFAAIEAGLRGAASDRDPAFADQALHTAFAQSSEALLRQTHARQTHPLQTHAAYTSDGGDGYERDGAYQEQGYQEQGYQEQGYQEQAYPLQAEQGFGPRDAEAGRSRRPVYVMAATIAVAVIGIGGAFALKGSTSSPAQIKTIMAAAGPSKVQPPADTDGSKDDGSPAGQTSQAPTKLVNHEEQPVDLTQAVQDNAARNPGIATAQATDASSVPVPLSPGRAQNAEASPGDGPDDQIGGFGSGMPAPKKVKVVSVTPEGVILPNDRPPVAAMPAPRQAPAKTSDHAGPVAKASTPKTATPKTTSRVASAPTTIEAAADAADGSAPKDLTPKDLTPKTLKKTKPQRVASVETATPEATEAAEPKVTGEGGWAVQLAAPGSEADAKAVSARLGKKFADALSGHQLAFHKAESNGRTVYRVRVGSLTKEGADSLCEKLKADQGSCFIAKN